MKDFFTSYTANDEPWAVWIAWQLDQAGYRAMSQTLQAPLVQEPRRLPVPARPTRSL